MMRQAYKAGEKLYPQDTLRPDQLILTGARSMCVGLGSENAGARVSIGHKPAQGRIYQYKILSCNTGSV